MKLRSWGGKFHFKRSMICNNHIHGRPNDDHGVSDFNNFGWQVVELTGKDAPFGPSTAPLQRIPELHQFLHNRFGVWFFMPFISPCTNDISTYIIVHSSIIYVSLFRHFGSLWKPIRDAMPGPQQRCLQRKSGGARKAIGMPWSVEQSKAIPKVQRARLYFDLISGPNIVTY